MANVQNLRPPYTSDQDPEEASKNGRKGGIAWGKKRRAMKTFRELAESFGKKPVSEKTREQMEALGIDPDDMIRKMQPLVALFNKANKGDVAAFNALRDIMGEKPIERQEIAIPTKIEIGFVSTGVAPVSSEDEIDG